MSKPYDKPEWDAPPPTDAGEIASVDFHARNALAVEHHVQRCQACEAPVRINENHVKALIREFDRPGGAGFDKVRFCDRACWIEWARQGETDLG